MNNTAEDVDLTKVPPVFSCHCSQTCTECVEWLTRAPLAECFSNDETCRCKGHEFAKANRESREKAYATGHRWRYQQ